MQNKLSYKNIDLFYLGSLFIVASLSVAMTSFLSSSPHFYYLSFFLMVIGILSMLKYTFDDLVSETSSISVSFISIAIFVLLFFAQRSVPFDFSLIESDASYYYWSGIGSVLHGDTNGMFLPMADAISAVGFQIFGIKYLASAEIILYLSALLLLYKILRELSFSATLSLFLIMLFEMIPLDIWISKTTFSEPIWQVLLLLFIYYTVEIMKKGSLDYKILMPFYIVLLLLPMTRGSSVFFYILLAYLSLYILWVSRNFRLAMAMAIGMVLLSVSIHYSMEIRWDYVVGMQYRRIFPHITTIQLSALLYSLTAIFLLSLWYLKRFDIRKKNLAFWVVLLSVSFKAIVALYFSYKKGVSFASLLYVNEYDMLTTTMGMPLAILSIAGLLYIHYKALRGERIYLLLVVFYHAFSVPFVMQNVTIHDKHQMFLYWHRYYFSEYLLVHFVALSISLKFLYEKVYKEMKKTLSSKALASGVILVIFVLSINLHTYTIVTNEGFLSGSHKLFDWIESKTKNSTTTIVYERTKHYTQRTLHRLMHAGIFAKRIDITGFYAVSTDELKSLSKLNKNPRIYRRLINSNKLLSLSSKDCSIRGDDLIFEDNLTLPLVWRQSSSDLESSPLVSYELHACLYGLKLSFSSDRKVRFAKHNEIANSLLGVGWHDREGNHPYSESHASLLLPDLFQKDVNYTLELEFKIYGSSSQMGKSINISIDGQSIYNETQQDNFPSVYKINLPKDINKFIKNDKLTIDIDVPNAVSPYGLKGKGDKNTRGIDLYSLKLVSK